MTDKITKSGLLVASALVLVFALPALGQQGPESLLPEGFGDPPPPPTPVAGRPAPTVPGTADGAASQTPSTVTGDADATTEEEEEEPELVIRFDVPPAARRSLGAVGIISEASGGFPADSFGTLDGAFLNQVVERTSGPIASRWGTIMARRLLASRTNTPEGVDGADWAAERAWLLLRMGDSVVARNLVQQVDGAVAHGTTLLLGGKRIHRPGSFMQTTILTDIKSDNPAFRQEFFGPVVSFFRVKDETAAIALANNCDFGLGGSVWTRDVARGQRVASQIDTGMMFVNNIDWTDAELPFGGIKHSGYGRELGKMGIEEFVNKKLVRTVVMDAPA